MDDGELDYVHRDRRIRRGCLLLYLSVHYKPLAIIGIFLVWFHWFADTLDGEVARARVPTNFGYYLDHFGDSISVVFIGSGHYRYPPHIS